MVLDRRIVSLGVALMCFGMGSLHAETLADWFTQSKVDGNIRAYYFSRLYGAPTIPNAHAFSLAGRLNVDTASFLDGFSVGISVFSAHSLGANDITGGPLYPHLDTTLMGPKYSINTLGQAYLQFKQSWVEVRAGDQILTTPWLGPSDARVIPATYQAVFANVTPVQNLHLYALREFRWKSRTSADYFKDNLYYKAGYDGDPLYGGVEPLLTGQQAQGTLAFGASYALLGAKAQAWYYNFYNFANTFYGDVSYTLNTGTPLDPFVEGQFVRQWLGNNAFAQNGVSYVYGPQTVSGGAVDSTAWGIKVGLNIPNGNVFWAYNALLPHPGAVGGGALVSPYTVGYATDPLFTTSMIRGLVELGPGNAWKAMVTQWLFQKQLLVMAAFARYYTYVSGSSNDTYLDVTYFPGGMFKGFSLRDRVEVSNGAPQNPGGGKYSFVYNRVMLQYNF